MCNGLYIQVEIENLCETVLFAFSETIFLVENMNLRKVVKSNGY